MLSVIIPTLYGREDSLKRCVDAYEATGPPEMEIITVANKPTWPTACNIGYTMAKGDILHFSADDLEPLDGWWQEAFAWLEEHDELPAPKVMDFSVDGPWHNHMDGPDKAIPEFTRIPLMRRDQYERIGPWPEYNYVADIWLSEKARTLGIETRNIHSYAFVHHWSQVGRTDNHRTLVEASRVLQRLRRNL